MYFCHGFSFGDKDPTTATGWFESRPWSRLSGVDAFRLGLLVAILALRDGDLVIVSVSISISGASRRMSAALVNVVRALAGVGVVGLPARKDGCLEFPLRNMSSREGR